MKSDGTVVVAGNSDIKDIDVSAWSDIVSIATDISHIFGLKSDGTVVKTGSVEFYPNTHEWNDIVSIAVFNGVCLKDDGTIVFADKTDEDKFNVFDWCDIIDPFAMQTNLDNLRQTLNEKAVARRKAEEDAKRRREEQQRQQEEEQRKRKLAEEQQRKDEETRRIVEEARQNALQGERRSQGVCPYCGGSFKGLFSKKCSVCGKPKDY